MRRTIALAATAALALTLGPLSAARADHDPGNPHVTITWQAPSDGATLDGVAPVKFTFSEDSLLRDVSSWKIEVVGKGVLCSETYAEGERDPNWSNSPTTVEFQWDTSKRVAGDGQTGCKADTVVPTGSALSANGSYTLKVTVTTAGAGDPLVGTSERSVTVSNDPSVPTGVKLKYDKKKDTITVSWAGNPEPDVTTYRLAECIVARSSKPCAEKDWKTFPEAVDGTSAAIETAGPGIYRYRVAAVRGSLVSGWATAQNDPTEIEVEEDPEPTTTTAPANDDDGDDEPQVVTRTVVEPTRRVQRAAPKVLQRVEVNEDRPYSDTLPYSEADSEALGGPLAGEDGDGDKRAVLIPLAGGAFFMMLAGHVWYLNRRTSQALQVLPVDDFGDGDTF